LTFSGLLNAIDGIITPDSSEPQLLFLTTNYKERLDSALIRPGRVDFQLLVDYCDSNQAKLLYERFYPSITESTQDNSKKFIHGLYFMEENEPPKYLQISAAQLQGYFMQYKFDENEAIRSVHELIDQNG
jgi:chaperone BCS1